MSGYDCRNKCVLSFRRNDNRDVAVVTSRGRVFQILGPAVANERSPTVTRRDGRTSRRLVDDDRRRRDRRPKWVSGTGNWTRTRSPISVLTGPDVDRSQRANHYARPPCLRFYNNNNNNKVTRKCGNWGALQLAAVRPLARRSLLHLRRPYQLWVLGWTNYPFLTYNILLRLVLRYVTLWSWFDL